MGIGFVLLIGAVVGCAFALLGSRILRTIVDRLTRNAGGSRRRLLKLVSAFPFLCLGWAGIVFVFQAGINAAVLHRDAGLGDSFECPLPGGYILSSIDTTDLASVKKVGAGGLDNVRFLQLDGPYILAASDSKAFQHFADQDAPVDSWFLLNTATNQLTAFDNVGALQAAAQRVHIGVNLLPVGSVYSKYRFTWFDLFAAFLLLGPPAIGFGLIARYVFQTRRPALV